MSEKLPFGPRNYKLMIIGLIIIIAGFTLMSLDTDEHGFGVLGLTIGPVVTVAGFLFELYAILRSPDNAKK